MDQLDQLDELLTCRLDFGRKVVEPCSIVIFGASGDLTARKLIPALYHLFVEKQLPNPCASSASPDARNPMPSSATR